MTKEEFEAELAKIRYPKEYTAPGGFCGKRFIKPSDLSSIGIDLIGIEIVAIDIQDKHGKVSVFLYVDWIRVVDSASDWVIQGYIGGSQENGIYVGGVRLENPILPTGGAEDCKEVKQ